MPSPEHQSLLNTLPGKIAHIYDDDSIDSYLKHNVVCRLIAKYIGANSASILLYRGFADDLFCAGRYIDPELSEAKVENEHKTGIATLNIMRHMDVVEFLGIIKQGVEEAISVEKINELYSQYVCYEFSNQIKSTLEDFTEFIGFYSGKDKKLRQCYEQYTSNTRDDIYVISPAETITGGYYYALTHSKNFTEFALLMSKYGDISLDIDRILIAPLHENKSKKVSSESLRKKHKITIKSDTQYIGMPLYANRRAIGILRLSLNDNVEVRIPESEPTVGEKYNFECDGHDKIFAYLKKIVALQGLSHMLALFVDNVSYTDGMRAISLKDSLKGNINNLTEIANELTRIVNCYGCLIRLTNSNGTNAEIKGCSDEVKEYVDAIKKHEDPYITKDGTFAPVLIDLLYKTKIGNGDENNEMDILCLKTDFDDAWKPTFSYIYIDKASKLVISDNWLGVLNSANRRLLSTTFAAANDTNNIFREFDIKSVIQIPIKDWQYGFVTFANTSNRTFLTKDVEMLVPVVTRLGLAIKYNSDIVKAENKSRDELFHGQRVLYHQMLSPIVSMRNSYINLRELAQKGNIDEKVFDLRIEEIINALETTVDFVKVSQFVSSFLDDRKAAKPNFERVSISGFVIDKARIYQPHAKIHRGLDIHVEIVEKIFPRINTDPVLLAHIMQALIDNAIKYSYNHVKGKYYDSKNPVYAPNDTIPNKIYITVQYSDKEREYSITVENWGLKINNKEKGLLTQYLIRGGDAKLFDTNGTGIGLFIVNILTEALNGKLEIIAEEDHTKISVKFKY